MANLRLEYRTASELTANPQNHRKHTRLQTESLAQLIDEVGWAGALLYNERTGRLIDGHLRQEVAGDTLVPVLIGDWDEPEEQKILLYLDKIGSLAYSDRAKLSQLVSDITATEQSALDTLLQQIKDEVGQDIDYDPELLLRDALPEIKQEKLDRDYWVLTIRLASESDHQRLVDQLAALGYDITPRSKTLLVGREREKTTGVYYE